MPISWAACVLLVLCTAAGVSAQVEERGPADFEILIQQQSVDDVSEDDPRLLQVHSTIAWGTLNQGNLELAEAMFRDILRRDPDRPTEIAGLAGALARQEKTAEAIAVLNEAVRRFPRNTMLTSMLGQAYLARDDNSSAQRWFEYTYCLKPRDPDIGYYLGATYLNSQWPLAALDVMCGAPTSGDEMSWTQDLAIGSAFSQLGLESEARNYFDSVARRAGGTPLANDAASLRRQLEEAIAGRPRFNGSLRISERYDDNPGIVPAANIGGLNLTNEDTAGNQYLGQFTYYLLRDANLDIAAGYTFLHTSNYETHEFDIVDNGLNLVVDRRSYWRGMPTLSGLRLDYDHLFVGSNDFLQRFLATPNVTFMTSDWDSTTLLFRYGLFDFLGQGAGDGSAFDLDAHNVMVGIQQQRQFCQRRAALYAGYQYDHNFAQGSNYDYDGHKLLAGLRWTTPFRDLTVGLNGELYYRDYTNADSVFVVERNDLEYVAQVSLEMPLQDGWRLWFEWNFDRDDSNTPTNDYRRNVVDAGVEYRFGGSE